MLKLKIDSILVIDPVAILRKYCAMEVTKVQIIIKLIDNK